MSAKEPYYCQTCSTQVHAKGRICARCSYIPAASKILPKHGLDGGEWVPNVRGVLEYRILPSRRVTAYIPPEKPKRMCIICDGDLPPMNRSYCSAPCRKLGEKKRKREYDERNGIVRGPMGRRRIPDTRTYSEEEMRAADNAYKSGDRSDWASEGRRQYRRPRKDVA